MVYRINVSEIMTIIISTVGGRTIVYVAAAFAGLLKKSIVCPRGNAPWTLKRPITIDKRAIRTVDGNFMDFFVSKKLFIPIIILVF